MFFAEKAVEEYSYIFMWLENNNNKNAIIGFGI